MLIINLFNSYTTSIGNLFQLTKIIFDFFKYLLFPYPSLVVTKKS